jgi:transcriptional regulator with PAS, ATPase and Fis domain
MREVFNLVLTLCRRTGRPRLPPVLISGETGTGKGQLARAIHYNGARSHQSLLEVNCASLPPSLIEGELFGCERGAYTGADAARTGLLEVANGGTIFLDEIDTLNQDLQAKLLRFLDDRCIRRLGSTVERTLDVHIIAATHRDLDAAVRLGEFREDLYYRLGVIHLKVPPLRERDKDVVDLARSFLEELCAEYCIPVKRLLPETEAAMLHYDWPGNVRELRNRLERVVLIVDSEDIEPRHLELPSLPARVVVKEGAIQVDLPREGVSLEAVEKAFIDAALDRCAGNVAQAARLLGLSRSALRYRLGR